ncbi:MAG: hypothetical protein JWP57_2185 [Spirosoma sp.]|nr:hypothetical protein [Spirosoma sp.]
MKTIRFPYLSVLLLLTLPLLAAFCSKKTSDPTPKNTHPVTVASVWAWKHLYVSPPVENNIDDIVDFYVQLSLLTSKCLPELLYEFKSDGTLIPISQTICAASGLSPLQFGPRTGDTWSVNGSKIVISHVDGNRDEADLELTDGTLSSGAKSKVMTWKRQIGNQQYTWEFERKL